MELGFETIGNATVICYDKVPVLATDPWITDQCYFGSWTHTHEIPAEQLEAIKTSRYIWFSHGHPDHLNPYSLPHFQGNKILLPNHAGKRIFHDLLAQGFDVTILNDREWTTLSDKIRVLCISDYNQDAILLIDLNGRLIVNANDSGFTGWERFVSNTVKDFEVSFYLAISGIGDADMCNFFDESGSRVKILPDRNSIELGRTISRNTDRLGAKYFIPFSSMHRYQRSDSAWTNEFTPQLSDYEKGYISGSSEILPAFIRYDCVTDELVELNPRELPDLVFPPEKFGDNWDDQMEKTDRSYAADYFNSIEHLKRHLDFVTLRVGGKDHHIGLGKSKSFKKGLTFEVPRNSLMSALSGEIFDDLLIGNFMKTTLHGNWTDRRLYPDFTPYVAKYADNGRAKSYEELKEYFTEYRNRFPLDYLKHSIEQNGISLIMDNFSETSLAYRLAQRVYSIMKFRK